MVTKAEPQTRGRGVKMSADERRLSQQVAALRDPELSAIYFMVARIGQWENVGMVLETRPRSHDPREVRLHALLQRLEVAGLVRRANPDESELSVLWEAA